MPENEGVYILKSSIGIKVGRSINAEKRRIALQLAQPYELELVFFGVLGERANEIEGNVKRLLRPWQIRGEWFSCDPFLAGIAIEAARDDCARRRAFIELQAKCLAVRFEGHKEMAIKEQAEREFPDLWARLEPPPNIVIGLGGRKIHLPPKKYTRLIVEGFPEVTYGTPSMPPLVAAMQELQKERERMEQRKKERMRK